MTGLVRLGTSDHRPAAGRRRAGIVQIPSQDRRGAQATTNSRRSKKEKGAPPGDAFLLKRWRVTVDWGSATTTEATVVAVTRGAAIYDAWRSDAFSGTTFRQFLGFASCRRDPWTPSRWGDRIMVLGKPAFFLGNNRQYVRFAFPGSDFAQNAHPYDVLPVEYRPDTYRDRDAGDQAAAAPSETGDLR
jgi:hypothetical protein